MLPACPSPRIVTQATLPIELSHREGKDGPVILSGRVNDGRRAFVLDTGAAVSVLIDGRTDGRVRLRYVEGAAARPARRSRSADRR